MEETAVEEKARSTDKATKNQQLFASGPIWKAVATMAVPTMLSMLVTVIYNMADTFFIGQTGDSNQVAAVSLCMPVFMIMMSVGSLFGIGGSSLISRSLGQRNVERAKKISSFCCYGCIIVSIVMAIIVLSFRHGILNVIGASENTYDFARSYLTNIAIGSPFVVFAATFNNLVRGEGAARVSMIGTLTGTIVNIILDPIMILTLDMGVAGAAIATVIGNVCACAFYISYFARKKSCLSIHPKYFNLNGSIVGGVFAIGVPAALNSLMMSFGNIILNMTLASFGDDSVAAMGVAMKINMLVVLLQIGLCMGIQPIIGYNFGAHNKKRLRQIYFFTGACTIVLGTILTIIMIIAREGLIRMFIDDAAVVEQGIKMIVALELSGPVVGILYLCTSTLQGMGKAVTSLILTVCRQGIVFIPLVLIMKPLLGLNGVIHAQPVADYITIILGLVICLVTMHRLHWDDNNSTNPTAAVKT